MDNFNNSQLRTLVKENRCFRDLICLEIEQSKICKVLSIAETTLFECLHSNPLCSYRINFGECLNICSCPIRQYLALKYEADIETKETQSIEF